MCSAAYTGSTLCQLGFNFDGAARLFTVPSRDVNVLIFLDFSFRYDSVHQKYKRLKRYTLQIMKFYGIE